MPLFTPEAHSCPVPGALADDMEGLEQGCPPSRPTGLREAIPMYSEARNSMRAILVDDYPPFLAALAALLRSQSAIEVVGRAHSGTDGLKLVSELEPDLVLVDYSMPD